VAEEEKDLRSREVDHDSLVGEAETADSGTDWAMTSICCAVTDGWDGCAPVAIDEGVEWGRVFGVRAIFPNPRGIGWGRSRARYALQAKTTQIAMRPTNRIRLAATQRGHLQRDISLAKLIYQNSDIITPFAAAL
jgi:hypothetical protein